MLFRIGRRVAGDTVGILAAAFLAVAILHVRDSHFAMTDVLMTLLVTASLALLLRALDTALAVPARADPIRWFGVAGLVGGLAASTRYSAAAIIVAMGAAQVLCLLGSFTCSRGPTPARCGSTRSARSSRPQALQDVLRWRAWAPAMAFLAAFAFGFIAATLYAVLDVETFATDLRFDFAHLSGGHGITLSRGWWYHLQRPPCRTAWRSIFIAAAAGVVPFAKHYPRHAAVIGTFSIAFYAAIGSGYKVLLPVHPAARADRLPAGRGGGANTAEPWLASRTGVSNRATLALLVVLAGGPALLYSVWLDVLLARTDTRVLAARWLAARLKPEESLHQATASYVELDLSDVRFNYPGTSMRATARSGSGRTHAGLAGAARVAARDVCESSAGTPPDRREGYTLSGLPGHARPGALGRLRLAGRVLHAALRVQHGRASGAERPDLPPQRCPASNGGPVTRDRADRTARANGLPSSRACFQPQRKQRKLRLSRCRLVSPRFARPPSGGRTAAATQAGNCC